jgi:hypothetical protein
MVQFILLSESSKFGCLDFCASDIDFFKPATVNIVASLLFGGAFGADWDPRIGWRVASHETISATNPKLGIVTTFNCESRRTKSENGDYRLENGASD